ncbi:S10 family serine carboxypeptidase-like protein [Legionella feeleii]|uniref:Serine carboxypeptidase n=1 Tax=Legionella feeleii TaxID=453 RepID=A0A378ISS1_9GAMM|nr:hypothetical protein [Legionella feeleii]STX37551.1 serine carboxypeptidase [Legionella feeleii]
MNYFPVVIYLFIALFLQNHLALAHKSSQQYMTMLLARSEHGYLPVEHGQLWYWFVKADHPDAPLTLWLNGGPGCSSMVGLFIENGPYLLQNLETVTKPAAYHFKENPYAWTKVSHMLYLDNPVGTGFSLPSRYTSSPKEMRQNVVQALQEFFTRHPELKKNAFFIFGESYAGKDIPNIAYEIKRSTDFNLKGIGMGNGFIDPHSINITQVEFAKNNSLIDEQKAKELLAKAHAKWQKFYELRDKGEKPSLHLAKKTAYFTLGRLKEILTKKHQIPVVNTYDIRIIKYPYIRDNLNHFLNDENYKPVKAKGSWVECGKDNHIVRHHLMNSIPISSAPLIVKLLKDFQLPILIFNGMEDLMVPYLSHPMWLDKYDIRIQAKDNRGLVYKAVDYPLELVFVKESGHMVLLDQPELAFELFKNFIERYD